MMMKGDERDKYLGTQSSNSKPFIYANPQLSLSLSRSVSLSLSLCLSLGCRGRNMN